MCNGKHPATLHGSIRKKVDNNQHQCNNMASEERKDGEVAACEPLNTSMEVITLKKLFHLMYYKTFHSLFISMRPFISFFLFIFFFVFKSSQMETNFTRNKINYHIWSFHTKILHENLMKYQIHYIPCIRGNSPCFGLAI